MRGRTAAAVCAAACLALPASAQAESATCDGAGVDHHRSRAKELIANGFSHSRWRDSTPTKGYERRLWTRHQRCLEFKRHRRPINEYRIRKRESFYRYRKAQRTASAYTPYDCGSHGRFAIPCYVVACESGYDWNAVNPSSGAFSAYQFLPSTYAGVCRSCDQARPDLHYAAHVVWARSGGSEWVCA